MSPAIQSPLMMSVAEFCRLHGIGETAARECINGTSKSYPPLSVKRVRKPGSAKSRIYITAEQAAEWRAALQDA